MVIDHVLRNDYSSKVIVLGIIAGILVGEVQLHQEND